MMEVGQLLNLSPPSEIVVNSELMKGQKKPCAANAGRAGVQTDNEMQFI